MRVGTSHLALVAPRRSRRCPSRRSSMGAFDLMDGEYEQVVYNHDPASGLKAIIAIHSTALGPALGGTRFYPYPSEDHALADVLRLARGMSFKAAAAGLNLGVGKVGSNLCRLLHEAGARLTVADVDLDNVARAVKEFGVDTVEPDKAHAVACDIFAPCALGAVVNDDTIPELKCAAIAGSGNNVLARDEHGYALRQLGILYAPDYVVNAGGLINVADELQGYSAERAKAKVEGIYGSVRDIFHRAKAEGVPTSEAADRLAKDRMREVSRLRLIRVLPGVGG